MKKKSAFILIMSFLISCSVKQTPDIATKYEKEFYAVLNDLVRIKLINTPVIQAETTPVSRFMWKQIVAFQEDETSSGGSFISATSSSGLGDRDWLDSIEIQYVYNTIDSTKTIQIDSAHVLVPTISALDLDRLFDEKNKKDGYEALKEKYGTSCFIKVSTPLFNSDYTKIIIGIDYQCGPKHGQGYVFIFEKRNGLWWLIEDIGTWTS